MASEENTLIPIKEDPSQPSETSSRFRLFRCLPTFNYIFCSAAVWRAMNYVVPWGSTNQEMIGKLEAFMYSQQTKIDTIASVRTDLVKTRQVLLTEAQRVRRQRVQAIEQKNPSKILQCKQELEMLEERYLEVQDRIEKKTMELSGLKAKLSAYQDAMSEKMNLVDDQEGVSLFLKNGVDVENISKKRDALNEVIARAISNHDHLFDHEETKQASAINTLILQGQQRKTMEEIQIMRERYGAKTLNSALDELEMVDQKQNQQQILYQQPEHEQPILQHQSAPLQQQLPPVLEYQEREIIMN